VLVPELNSGQLRWLIRAKYLVDAEGLNKVQGRPFLVSEIEERIAQMLGEHIPAERVNGSNGAHVATGGVD
jgi:2-oxoglutarate ferredoxin oxidoreductase subunit alpha